MTDKDAVLLSGDDYDCIVGAVNEAQEAVCEMLDEFEMTRQGGALREETALSALMKMNTAIRHVMKTVSAASKRSAP